MTVTTVNSSECLGMSPGSSYTNMKTRELSMGGKASHFQTEERGNIVT